MQHDMQECHRTTEYHSIFKSWGEPWLKPLIKWPNREELLKTMPIDLRANIKKCVVIIN